MRLRKVSGALRFLSDAARGLARLCFPSDLQVDAVDASTARTQHSGDRFPSRSGLRAATLPVFLLASLWASAAFAQAALETVPNGTVANSGPTGNGPVVTDQLVTLRHNTNNPAGNTMVARTPAVTVTYSLVNQQYTGLTPAQGFPASTGGNAVVFGVGVSDVISMGSGPIYSSFSASPGGSTAGMFTSVNASAGQGINVSSNAGVLVGVSPRAIAVATPSIPVTTRVQMADLVLTFNMPVDNPILHFAGMGGDTTDAGTGAVTAFSSEFDLVTPGLTLSRLSGNPVFTVTGNQINSSASIIDASCPANQAACGSVRVDGIGITSLTLRISMRNDGRSSNWAGDLTSHPADGFAIGVSLNEATPTLTINKVTTDGVGTFDFTGTNGITATSITTTVAGMPVSAPTQVLANVNASTTITEASVPGYRLTDITCSGLGAGGTATPTLPAIHAAGGGNVVLDAAATAMGSNIQCTFTNQRVPILRLQKSIPNGRAVAGNQFTLRIADGATIVQSATTTGTGSTATGIATLNQAVAGTTYTLSEIPAGSPLTVLDNYLTTYSCTNALAGGQTPSGAGTSFDVTPVAGDDLTCTFTNTFRPRLTIRKTSVGGTGSFSFSGDNGFADQTLVTATPGTPVSGALQGLAAVNTVTTITEDEPPPGYALTGASCTGFPTGGAATVDLAARTLTLNAAATAPGANVTCTFTNTLVPVVTIRKTSLGGTGSFDFSGSNGIVSQTLVTTESGTPVSGVTQVLTTPGVSTTITEAVPPTGYALTGIACTGMAGSGTATANLGTRTVTLNAAATAAGANIVCTFTNTLRPLVTVRKISEGGIGSFAFTGSNGIAAQTLVTTASGVPLGGTPQALTTPGTATTITESAPPTGYVLTDITCTDLPVGGTATPNLGTRTVTLNAAATVPGANVTCTFTNARPAIIRLQKSLPGGRAVAGNQFTLRIADGATVLQSATTTGTGSTATGVATLNPAVAGTTYTLSEIAAGSPVTVLSDYATTYSCINAFAGGQTPIGTGTSFDVTPVLGDDLTCTFANARSADLSISKTDGATTYTPGQAITYTIVASNAGPSPVVGARVSDPFPAAITGVTWTCGSGTGGGTCGAASGSGNLSNAVANLPSGATVTFLATGIVADSATGNLTNTATITGPAVGSPADPDLGNNSATDTDTYIAPPPPVFACNANTIYSIPFLSSGLTPVSRIDVNTGGSATFVTLPATPSGTTWNGLGINPASDLVHAVTEGLGSSNAGRVLTYTLGTPPSSATLSPAPSNRYSGGFVAGAVNPVTGWYYSAAPISNGSSTLVLFAYDPAWGATQAPIEVGRINTTGTGGDLTFDSLGNLYLLSGSTVYRVDGPVPQSSSTATLPASVVTVSSSGGVGIAFSNGELIFQSNTTYRRFNPTTGALIGSFTSIGGTDLASCESPSTIRLRKNLPDGRVVTGDQFGLAITLTAGGTILGNTATTTGSASGMQPAIAGPVLGLAGTSYTLTETAAGTTNLASYTSSLTCTNETNGSPVGVTANASGQSGTFVMPDNGGAGSNILCTFTNSGSATDLSIAKTSTVSEVLAGSTISYDIVVINNGPSAADNATVSDDWITLPGLDCSAGPVTCAASGTAGTQCPAVGSVTPAALQAGLAIPALPNGGIVTLTVQCAVTASGL